MYRKVFNFSFFPDSLFTKFPIKKSTALKLVRFILVSAVLFQSDIISFNCDVNSGVHSISEAMYLNTPKNKDNSLLLL